MLGMLRRTGEPMEIKVESLNGTLPDAGAGEGSSSTATLPSTSKSGTVAAVVVTGTAPDKKAVAAYVDALGEEDKLANPYVTSVTTDKNHVTFSLNVDITRKALCGRFGTPCKPTGGN